MKKIKLKTGPKPKPTCSNGHNIEIVGRTKAGNCKQCDKEWHKARWDWVKKTFPKPS
jgi:hypothetical protein